MNKKEYVLNQKQTRNHICHWPGCNIQVPPAMWGCKKHWLMLPKSIRNLIWEAYRCGQEIDMNVSNEYIQATEKAKEWISKNKLPR